MTVPPVTRPGVGQGLAAAHRARRPVGPRESLGDVRVRAAGPWGVQAAVRSVRRERGGEAWDLAGGVGIQAPGSCGKTVTLCGARHELVAAQIVLGIPLFWTLRFFFQPVPGL